MSPKAKSRVSGPKSGPKIYSSINPRHISPFKVPRKDVIVAKVLIQAVHIVKQASAGKSGTLGLLRGFVVFEGTYHGDRDVKGILILGIAVLDVLGPDQEGKAMTVPVQEFIGFWGFGDDVNVTELKF